MLFKTIGAEQIDLATTFSFGRAEADVSFPDDQDVSPIHGQFIVEGEKGYIRDNGSATGTFVNDVQIPANQKVELQEGDRIRFGAQIVYFTKERMFKAIPGEEELVSQTGKELLAKARKLKEAKVHGIEEKLNQAKAILKKITDDLENVSSKIALADKAISEAEKRQHEIQAEVQRLTTNKESIRKTLEEKKIPLCKRQLTLKDKLQLLDMAQAPDSQKQPLQDELNTITEQLKAVEEEKKSLPQVIVDLKKKSEEFEKKNSEYSAQREKLRLALEERQKKYAPDIKRLQEELKSHELALAKARESIKR
ncbi:MAG: hypothetical protein A2X86_09470 [Bdellovibrionales bacterium GWA2_49_15]|nr:MAG: hypothetical protein A2X86_09470 [Bdellovibrionales bacterium GWA2_49_15]